MKTRENKHDKLRKHIFFTQLCVGEGRTGGAT